MSAAGDWRADMGLPLTRTDPPAHNPHNTHNPPSAARTDAPERDSADCADSAEGVASASTTATPLDAAELRRRYARHLAAVAGTLDTLAAEKLAAWVETALDYVESDPAVNALDNREARAAAARVLSAAGIPTPPAIPLRLAPVPAQAALPLATPPVQRPADAEAER